MVATISDRSGLDKLRDESSVPFDNNTHHSTLRERIVEHIFVGEALRALWCVGVTNMEVFRPEFDAHGYDLAMAQRDIVRHIQFKTGKKKPRRVTVARSLAEKPSGCVIWILINEDLEPGSYYWFGGEPGCPLPDIASYPNSKRVTPNAQGRRPIRLNHHEVPIAKFEKLGTLQEVLKKLFGETSV